MIVFFALILLLNVQIVNLKAFAQFATLDIN